MNPRRVFFCAIVLSALMLAWGITISPCLAGAPPSVSVKGLRIVAKGYSDSLRPFNWTKGTTMVCLLMVPEGGIVDFAEKESTLDTFADDTGTSLLDPNEMFNSGFGSMADISRDGKAVMFEIRGTNLPAAGAAALKAAGTLVVRTATKKKSNRIDGVALKKGTTIQAAGMTLTITEVKKPDWGDAAIDVTFQTNQDPLRISAVHFYDASGNKIDSSQSGSSALGFQNVYTYTRTYGLSKKADTVSVEIVTWEDMKVRKLPFSATATLGL